MFFHSYRHKLCYSFCYQTINQATGVINHYALVLVPWRASGLKSLHHCLSAHLQCAVSVVLSDRMPASGFEARISTEYKSEQYLLEGPHKNPEWLFVLVPAEVGCLEERIIQWICHLSFVVFSFCWCVDLLNNYSSCKLDVKWRQKTGIHPEWFFARGSS